MIKTPLTLGDEIWEIEITLTNRDSMGHRMLIGREAMNNRVLIDPDSSMCLGAVSTEEVKKHYNVVKPRIPKVSIYLIHL